MYFGAKIKKQKKKLPSKSSKISNFPQQKEKLSRDSVAFFVNATTPISSNSLENSKQKPICILSPKFLKRAIYSNTPRKMDS